MNTYQRSPEPWEFASPLLADRSKPVLWIIATCPANAVGELRRIRMDFDGIVRFCEFHTAEPWAVVKVSPTNHLAVQRDIFPCYADGSLPLLDKRRGVQGVRNDGTGEGLRLVLDRAARLLREGA